MAEVKDSTATHNKTLDKHYTGTEWPCGVLPDPRAQGGVAVAPPGAPPSTVPPRPPLNRVDSRTAIPNPAPRPVGQPVAPQQQRPQFQPGGPVNNPPQFAPRPGTPAPRGPPPAAPSQLQRPVAPLQRPLGPTSTAPQQPIRGPQPPLGAPPQRAPVPTNLQFGPRQPPQLAVPTTPDGTRPPLVQTYNGVRNGAPQGSNLRPLLENQRPPLPADITRQQPGFPKGPDTQNTNQINRVTLDNQNSVTDHAGTNRPEKLAEPSGLVAKNRSYSIAGPAAAANPFATDEFRRNSVSAVSGRPDELTTRGSDLGSIYEGKPDVKDSTIRGSKESVRSEASNESRDISERPESRLSGSKMSDSIIGSFKPCMPKKKPDDDDDVILQNNKIPAKVPDSGPVNKTEIYDRSPSLTRSDESPESKQSSVIANKAMPIPKPNVAPEIQRVSIPKDNKVNEATKDIKASSAILNNISKPAEPKSPTQIIKKPTELYTDSMKSTPRRVASAPKPRPKDGDNDSGVDESTQGNDTNGSPSSPNKKTPSKLPTKASNGVAAPSLSRSSSKSATAKTPENPLPAEKKKVPMNKVQVGNAPSPNIKAVKSKIGSLNKTTYKPGGGKVKIENRKLDFQKVTPRIAAKNDAYVPSGGTKKITTTKLEWNAKSKIGSLENTTYRPGGGDKKIESVKLDFKEKAKPKVASTVNITHKPGGGAVKIENQKLEFRAESKVGSLDNVKHRPGGGEIKIFDDKDYIKNISGHSPALSHSGQEDFYMSLQDWEDKEPERSLSRCRSARAPISPRSPRLLSPRRRATANEDEHRVLRNNERNKRPATARNPPRSACSRTSSSIHNRPAFTVY